jgi:hypothetical protein
LQLNEAMVELGWAVAYREYSQDYVEAEERAKLRQAGIWNSTFTMPSAHRLCPFEGIIEQGPEASALPVCSNAVAGQPAQRQPLPPGSVHWSCLSLRKRIFQRAHGKRRNRIIAGHGNDGFA